MHINASFMASMKLLLSSYRNHANSPSIPNAGTPCSSKCCNSLFHMHPTAFDQIRHDKEARTIDSVCAMYRHTLARLL